MNELVLRHESLRTIYPTQGGIPSQVIQPFERFSLPVVDLLNLPEGERKIVIQAYASEHEIMPFILEQESSGRYALLRAGPQEDYLYVGIHHINFDAWSQNVFIRDLILLYDANRLNEQPKLPELTIQYSDYALALNEWLKGETRAAFIEHWKNILSGELPTLELPIDRQRPPMQTDQGARIHFDLSPVLSAKIKEFCRNERITPFHLFLAVYAVLLMHYSGQEDIILGCPFANRPRPEQDGMVGLFVNVLPIRLNLGGDPSVHDLLKQVRAVILDAFIWQALPFESLVAEIAPPRDLSRTPVYQVMINMRNVPKRQKTIPGLEMELVRREEVPAVIDISYEFSVIGDHFDTSVVYNKDLFDRPTILRMVSHYQNILDEFLINADCTLSELEMVSPSKRRGLPLDRNYTQSVYPNQCIHKLISEQAAKNPVFPAVICNGRHLTYSAIERNANQLASCLLEKEVKPGNPVGIFLPRSEDLLVAQLAILKVGGTCVPFDPSHPGDRLAYMLDDTNPSIVITHSSLEAKIPDKFKRIYLNNETAAIQVSPYQTDFAGTDLDTPIYITYTSGSTGRPKGVINIQRGVLNYITHLIKTFHLHSGDRVIQFSPISFDVSFRDTIGSIVLWRYGRPYR